ncbi:MAG: AI-2E family transporter [Hellea sp.]|nr:AI-2E family transporter [Hellea sp.]
MQNDRTIRACLLFICFVLAVYSLYVTQHLLAPFAMAIFIWIVIDTFARWIDGLTSKIPYWAALTMALTIVFLGLTGVVLIITDTAVTIANDSEGYAKKITRIFNGAGNFFSKFEWVRENVDMTSEGLNERFGIAAKVQSGILGFTSAIISILQNFVLIAVYVAFLFAAQAGFTKKVDDLFPDPNKKSSAVKIMTRIRTSVEKYVGVQTVVSLVQTVLSYFVMAGLGLENALFWAMVIFIMNYIPIIGGIVAVAMPVLFGVVEFDNMTSVALLAGGLFLVQFIINSTLQPKMMGDSMNLSSLVVLLSLAMWAALWGGVGAFLGAPLTVMLMIILAQFETTRWIAILLSADGHPELDEIEKKVIQATPGM